MYKSCLLIRELAKLKRKPRWWFSLLSPAFGFSCYCWFFAFLVFWLHLVFDGCHCFYRWVFPKELSIQETRFYRPKKIKGKLLKDFYSSCCLGTEALTTSVTHDNGEDWSPQSKQLPELCVLSVPAVTQKAELSHHYDLTQ